MSFALLCHRTPNHIFECYVELVRQNEEEGEMLGVPVWQAVLSSFTQLWRIED
jgi:hypothetical protein